MFTDAEQCAALLIIIGQLTEKVGKFIVAEEPPDNSTPVIVTQGDSILHGKFSIVAEHRLYHSELPLSVGYIFCF